MLSKPNYSVLCMLGTEVFYAACLAYGLLLSGKAQELHHALLELIPGFAWGSPVNMVGGALYLGALSLAVGWYIAWMHNVSLVTSKS
jgi:hypothetical protein